jgi:hypothetical protein
MISLWDRLPSSTYPNVTVALILGLWELIACLVFLADQSLVAQANAIQTPSPSVRNASNKRSAFALDIVNDGVDVLPVVSYFSLFGKKRFNSSSLLVAGTT